MISNNLHNILESIETIKIQHNIKTPITLVAVSKYSTENEILQAYNAGQVIFGENKVQDLHKKAMNLANLSLEWHFIGTLQENKINTLIRLKPKLLHSLDSHILALALQKRLQRNNTQMNALLQINISNESTKHGFEYQKGFESYLEILESCPNIKLEGLMCMGTNTLDSKVLQKDFEKVRHLFEKLMQYGAKTLSMGMSNDYKIALLAGSNCLRIGSQIFKTE